MSQTLYATFSLPEDAEKAAGALLDRGARAEDLSVVKTPEPGESPATAPRATASNVASPGSVYGVAPEPVADGLADDVLEHHGETRSTAIQGGLIGAGIGAVAAIAALVVPGVGIVLGAGALASALGGLAATAGAGAAAGAIVGYLKEQGVDEDAAGEYGEAIQKGGAVLAIALPSGEIDEDAAARLLQEHGATNVNRYASRGYVA